MEATYLAALEILILGFATCYFPVIAACILGAFIVAGGFFYKNRSPLIWIIPLLFLIRILTVVDVGSHFHGEELFLRVDAARGRVERINGKIPRRETYISGDLMEYGKVNLDGKLKEIKVNGNREYLYLESATVDAIPQGIINKYLDEKVTRLTRGYSGEMERFYRAVIMGDKTGLSDEIKEIFSYTGTSHLIVISGLHIGVVIAIIIFISSKLPLGRDFRYLVAAAVLTLYTAGVGLAPSVLRAYIMGMCYIGGELLYEKPDPKKSLSAAFIISSLMNPLAMRELSFQMSFMAVFAIIYIYPKVEKRAAYFISHGLIRKIFLLMAMSLTIQLFLTPIFLVYFRSIPVFSFLVNLVAIPLGVIFVQTAFGALLLSTVGMGEMLMPTVNLSYYILVNFIELASRIPWLSIGYYGIKVSGMLFILYSIIFGLIFLKKQWKPLVVIPCAAMFFMEGPSPPERLMYNGMTYYGGDLGFVVINYPLSRKGLIFLRDNGVRSIGAIISTGKTDEKLKKILGVSKEIKLYDGDEATVGNKKFINRNGRVLEVEKIEKNIQI